MFVSLFDNPFHLLVWAAVLVLVMIPAAIALRVWMRE